jgi:hypothetical protein
MRATTPAYLHYARQTWKPRKTGMFAGKPDHSTLPLFDRITGPHRLPGPPGGRTTRALTHNLPTTLRELRRTTNAK